VPGKLYDTLRGYPAASFDLNTEETVAGELYWISRDVDKKLEYLDRVEGTRDGLYQRKKLGHGGYSFYLYEAGELLKEALTEKNRIETGNWRRYGSAALDNPAQFALTFEEPQRKRYRKFPPDDSIGLIFLRGQAPILVTASHATAHLRMNVLKYEEQYTGALAVILHILTGTHAFYTHLASKIDPNYYDEAPFKKKVEETIKKYGIKFVIDLHGTRTKRNEDIYPGVGNNREFLLGNDAYLIKLEELVKSSGLILGGTQVFPASRQMTITKFISSRLSIPAMQVEISERLRQPDKNPSEFVTLVRILRDLICSIKTSI
jgi:gamma-glutamylcyclotransferase (GGCT)/AIG2-like uncharacterized protein YtfP